MNLRAIANTAVQVINQNIPCTVRVSTGYITDVDGTRTPTFNDVPDIPAQVQSLSSGDIEMLDGLQLNGDTRAIYLNGRVDNMVRADNTGGDLIVFPADPLGQQRWPFGTVWKVTSVLEQWPDWVKVAVTLQNGS